ncbi:MAG TPA: hypothetical protein VEJ20_00375 [Candidatus Eremiobacteraceae bacterium]|nr:hypothetical protein [Candidatus Eremiobacteraceae bacterium]
MPWSSRRLVIVAAAIVGSAAILAAGTALRPTPAAANARVHPEALVTCSSGGACQEYDNRSTGQALDGETGGGTGLLGDATKAGTGVEGESATGNGVEGSTSGGAGSVGVLGSSGAGEAVRGSSGSGTAIVGQSATGTGAVLEGDQFGALANANDSLAGSVGLVGGGSTGVEASGGDNGGAGILDYTDGGPLFLGDNVVNETTQIFEIDASGNVTDNSEIAQGEVVGGDDETSNTGGTFDGEYYGVIGSNYAGNACACGTQYAVWADGYGGDLFVGNNSSSTNVFVVDNSGNTTIAGLLYTSGSCHSGCVQSDKPGTHVLRYTPTETEPTIEDFGEGRLVNGSGYVQLDPSFANTIDQTTSYMVFITPEGDNRGLYVTEKSASGFAVRESQGGHSTLAFSWRIVAKPYGVNAARLPMVLTAADEAKPPPYIRVPRARVIVRRPNRLLRL